MWQTLVSRRELVDLILSGQQTVASVVEETKLFADIPKTERGVLLCWREDPALYDGFPIVAVLQDDERDDFIAAINSTSSAPSPFSAFCRTITASEAALYSQANFNEGSREVLSALAGLSFGEAIAHAGGSIRSTDLTPAICKRTIAYAWAKALSNRVPVEQFEKIIEGWFEALALSSASDRIELMRRTVSSEVSILKIATEIYYGLPHGNLIGELCQALVDGDKRALDRQWSALTSHLPERISLFDIANSTREERGAIFQSALKHLYASDIFDELAPAICAFLATQISPASFDHLDFLSTRSDVRLSLWYAFMAALQKPRGVLGFAGGLGSRLIRDLDLRESFKDGPVGDISLSELRVLARAGLEGVSKKLGHSNEIEVEIIPLVTCSFRFQSRQNKQSDFFENQTSTQLTTPVSAAISPFEQIQNVIKNLEDVADFLSKGSSPDSRKSQVKRSRKKY